MLKKIGMAALAAMVLGVGSSADAATIFTATTLSGCSNCYGLTYTLTVGDAGDSTATTFNATLNVTGTLSGASSDVTRISAVSFKVANGVVPPLTLTTAPNGNANWTTTQNNINNGGCEGSGAGFVCSEGNNSAAFATITGGPVNLTWAWTFSLASGTTPSALHIGAKLNNTAGTMNGKIVSEKNFTVTTPPTGDTSVPDGGMTLSLLGLALTGVGLVRRRLQ